MNAKTKAPWQHDVLWGLVLGVAVSVGVQILTWMGLGLTYWTWVVTYLLVALFAVLAARSLLRRNGSLGLPRTAILVLVLVLVSKLIFQIYMFLYIHAVDPGWVDRVAEVWAPQLRESGASEAEIERQISAFRRNWSTPYIFTLGVIAYALPQAVIGFVAAALGAVWPGRRKSRAARTTIA